MGILMLDGCRRIKIKEMPHPSERAHVDQPPRTSHAPTIKSPQSGLLIVDGCRRIKPKKEPISEASFQIGSFFGLAWLVTRQIGYYTNSRRSRFEQGVFRGCPVR